VGDAIGGETIGGETPGGTIGGRPTLILVTGPGGAGKTTLAHALARRVGCPVISRDELKEGMVAATPGFVPAESDPLTMRTYGLFFAVIRLLLEHGVTHVAEAAFQHELWFRGLEPLQDLAELRIVRCQVPVEVRRRRAEQRGREVATRAAHDDAGYFAAAEAFDAIRMSAPTLDVDTGGSADLDYRPGLAEVLAFVRSAAGSPV
jgi:predicted kinase